MKTTTTNLARKESLKILKTYFLFFLFTILLTTKALADGGPSFDNFKKNAQALKTEQEKIDKQRAFDEKMSYVYMFLGLAAVIAVAWFSTVLYAKKSKKLAIETNHHRHYIRHPHDPHRRPKVNSLRR